MEDFIERLNDSHALVARNPSAIDPCANDDYVEQVIFNVSWNGSHSIYKAIDRRGAQGNDER